MKTGKSSTVFCMGLGLTFALMANAQVTPATAPSPTTTVLVQANNRFAIDFFQKVSPNVDENAFLSPYSLSSALAMTWAGARGETADQMAKALHLSELPAGEVTGNFTMLQAALAEAQTASGAQLSVANSLWPEQDPEKPFLPEYIGLVEKDFAAGLFPVDFKSHHEEARLKINQWVEDKTQDKITNLLHSGDLTSLTRLVLVNAIYFKGQWAKPFEAQATRNDMFHLGNGGSKPVMLMSTVFTDGEARYADITNGPVPCQVLSLNYEANTPGPRRGGGGRGFARGPMTRSPGLSMLVVLPRQAEKLGALEQTLSAEQLGAWADESRPVSVRVFLPKFRLDERYDKLPDQLKELGMTSAFMSPGPAEGADFSGMIGVRGLFISKVIHQTFVSVDEKGTEAAAASAVVMGFRGAPPANPVEFRADHPFLFFIRENATGSILFMGRLANPLTQNAAEAAPAR